jgi:hypothetical protein
MGGGIFKASSGMVLTSSVSFGESMNWGAGPEATVIPITLTAIEPLNAGDSISVWLTSGLLYSYYRGFNIFRIL